MNEARQHYNTGTEQPSKDIIAREELSTSLFSLRSIIIFGHSIIPSCFNDSQAHMGYTLSLFYLDDKRLTFQTVLHDLSVYEH
jgi:hypothetical protein